MTIKSTTESGQFHSVWQESVPEIAWHTLLLALGIGVGYFLTIDSAVNGSLPYPVATLICAYLTFASFSVLHDAGHGSIFKVNSPLKPLESLIGWVASLPFIIVPYRFFQKIHDRHHAFTNDPDRDPDHYTFGESWGGLVLNSLYIPVQYQVLALTKLRNVKIFRNTYPSSAAYFLLTFSTLIILSVQGYGLEVLCFAIIPLVIAVFFLAMVFDYIPHHPHKSRDRYHDTRAYPSKILNWVILGQNYHLIHHMYPRVPWFKYQEVFYKVLPDLEANNAPIENIGGGVRPGFMKSPNVSNLLDEGNSINMVLDVSDIKQVASDAVSIEFELPHGETLKYQAGQYITVSKWLEGEQQTRCYSICTSPRNGKLKVGVRKTQNGLVSGFLNNDLGVGDKLIVQGPFGDFAYSSEDSGDIDRLVLIAGGSGITPILSIVETALADDSEFPIDLIYACRSRESIMFFDALDKLKKQNPTRLNLRYVVEQDSINPLDVHGRLDEVTLKKLVPELEKNNKTSLLKNAKFFMCGPEGLKNSMLEVLNKNNVGEAQVNVEEFVSTLTKPIGEQYKVDVLLAGGQTHTLEVASNQTVLEVAKAQRVQLPHACGSGTCGSCKFKVNQGETASIPNSIPGITEEEKNSGLTLACQCKPLQNISISEA